MARSNSNHGVNDIGIDLYKKNHIMKWQADLSRIEPWLNSLDDATATLVLAAIRLLEQEGPNLKRPLVGEVKGSRFRNMKELRPGSTGASEIRVLFAFDPRRCAIMLFAGDKQRWWDKWYRRAIPKADRLYQEHLDELEREGARHGSHR
ncbi:type II toxin-antitoxin system RelE/ParE family toxin [uncultured Adlercreutzia sp.]|uniref:type II toxin-antitoxin system RelE/ParE family toxin n=1 Tax=uncultured Adlercreutzia sp. TaxID=875803 RepID=UPI0025EE7432|nr:type II toxin-antitoxin system RelE/ParE family toxin [uncultured Adlercreutzia sp.]